MIISHKYQFIFIKTAKTAGTSIEVFLSPLCGELDVFTPFSEPEPGHIPRNYMGWFNPINDIKVKWDFMKSKGNIRALWPIRETVSFFFRNIKYYHHIPAWQVKNRLLPVTWQNYYKFCVERNPYEKVVSAWYWYMHKKGVQITFNAYLKKCEKWMESRDHAVGTWPYNFLNYTESDSANLMVDKIIYYEHLQDELSIVFRQLNIKGDLNKLPTSKGGLRDEGSTKNTFSQSQIKVVNNLFLKEFEMHDYPL